MPPPGSHNPADAERTEKERRRREAVLTGLVSICIDAMIAVDDDQNIVLFNPGAEAIFGYTTEEVLGRSFDLLFPEPLREIHRQHVRDLAAGSAKTLVLRNRISGRRKNGEIFPADVSISKTQSDSEALYLVILRDATADVRSEEALRQANETLQELIRASPLAIVAFDAERRIEMWNPAAERLYGWTEREMVGMPYPAVPPGREHEGRSAFERALRGHTVGGYETVRMRKDGSLVDVRIWAAPFGAGSGRARGVVALIEDITTFNQAREAQRRLTAILEATPDFVGTADPEGRVLYVNRAGRRMLGAGNEDLVGRHLTELHPPAAAALLRDEAIPTAIREGHWKGEAELLGPGGRRIPVSQVVLAHRRPNGRVGFLSTIIRDISEQRRAADAQAFLAQASRVLSGSLEEREVLRALTEIVVPRLATYCLIHIEDEHGSWHRASAKHSDPSKQTLVEQLGRFPPPRAKDVGAGHVLRSGEAELVFEVSEVWVDATCARASHRGLVRALAPESILIVPLRARGRVIGTMTCAQVDRGRHYDHLELDLAQDLADRAALAIDNARLHEQAQIAIRSRDEVLRLVAHDLQNPLSTIALAANLLHEEEPADETKAPSKPADIIRRSASRASRLIGDLLDVARMEAGRLSVDRRPVAAAPLVHEAIELNKGLADEKRIRIDAKTPSRLPTISADRERVLQVFGNLLGNAIKFTPTGGQVTVAADHSDRSARFMVADNGPGITPEQQGKLFVPFWQSKPEGRVGAGLGLSICKAIVEAHGGRIWVESHAGRGTAFYFTVPLASAREEERQPSSGDAADEDEDHHD